MTEPETGWPGETAGLVAANKPQAGDGRGESRAAAAGLGLTTWSPLASGLLSGKYLDGVPADSRAALPGYEWLRDMVTDPDRGAKVARLVPIAEELGCTLGQLAIAWCAANPRVSSVITGASNADQVAENLGALRVLDQLDAALLARIDTAVT